MPWKCPVASSWTVGPVSASLQPACPPAVLLRAHESPDDTGSQGTKRGHMTAPGHTSLQGQGRQIPSLSFCVLALRTALLGLFPPKEFLHLPYPKKHSLISTRAVGWSRKRPQSWAAHPKLASLPQHTWAGDILIQSAQPSPTVTLHKPLSVYSLLRLQNRGSDHVMLPAPFLPNGVTVNAL